MPIVEELGLRPRRLSEFDGQPEISEHLAIILEAAALGGPGGRSPPLRRSARAGQDHVGPHRRRRARRAVAHHVRARRSSAPAISRRCSRTSTKATCCSSTRSIAWRAPSKRCCIRRWRTSNSTSCWGRARRHDRSVSISRASRWWAPPRAPASSPARCAIDSGSSRDSSTTSPRISRRSSCEPRGFSASRSTSTGRVRSPAGRGARPASPTGCCGARATSPKVRGNGVVDGATAQEGLLVFGVDERGLDKVDRAVLSALCERFGGGPVGLKTLADRGGRARRDGGRRVRAVPHPARAADANPPRPGGHAGRLGPSRRRPLRRNEASSPVCSARSGRGRRRPVRTGSRSLRSGAA